VIRCDLAFVGVPGPSAAQGSACLRPKAERGDRAGGSLCPISGTPSYCLTTRSGDQGRVAVFRAKRTVGSASPSPAARQGRGLASPAQALPLTGPQCSKMSKNIQETHSPDRNFCYYTVINISIAPFLARSFPIVFALSSRGRMAWG